MPLKFNVSYRQDGQIAPKYLAVRLSVYSNMLLKSWPQRYCGLIKRIIFEWFQRYISTCYITFAMYLPICYELFNILGFCQVAIQFSLLNHAKARIYEQGGQINLLNKYSAFIVTQSYNCQLYALVYVYIQCKQNIK